MSTRGALHPRSCCVDLPSLCQRPSRAHTFFAPIFRVHNKIFATLRPMVRPSCSGGPANVDTLISADPVAFWDEWRGRVAWGSPESVRAGVLRDLIADAWRTVAPKRLAAVPMRSWFQNPPLTSVEAGGAS